MFDTASVVERFHTICEGSRFGIRTLEVDGAMWRVATDGHLLVAERGEEGEPMDHEGILSVCRKHLSTPQAPPVVVSVSALAEWTGPRVVSTEVPCKECGGTGEVYHVCGCPLCESDGCDVECSACAGAGSAEDDPEPYPVRLSGCRFDRNYLAGAVALLDGFPTAQAWTLPFSGAHTLALFTDSVRIVCTGMRPEMGSVDEPSASLVSFAA